MSKRKTNADLTADNLLIKAKLEEVQKDNRELIKASAHIHKLYTKADSTVVKLEKKITDAQGVSFIFRIWTLIKQLLLIIKDYKDARKSAQNAYEAKTMV